MARVAVIGFGVTGQSVVRHLRAQDDAPEIIVLDTRAPGADLPEEFAGLDIRWGIRGWPDVDVQQIVLSPGLGMESCLARGAVASGVPVVSDIDLFFEAAKAPVIGITGTNGKSTVTSLVGHMLRKAGSDAGVGGNLGDAALDLLADEREYYVLELSSFQLERSREHPYASAALLNVSEDHIDQHGTFEHYCRVKQRIFTNAEHCVFNRDDEHTHPEDGRGVSFGLSEPVHAGEWGLLDLDGTAWIAVGRDPIVAVEDLPLAGTHNALNVMAACALVERFVPRHQFRELLQQFRGLPHRFEKVAVLDGVTYVDDSKATNVGATLAALNGLPVDQKLILIAGGDAKGADLSPLQEPMRRCTAAVIVLGVDGPLVAHVAETAGVPVIPVATLEEAVLKASELSEEGDMVLLSPACASLDMFSNYMERGRSFQAAVADLQRGAKP